MNNKIPKVTMLLGMWLLLLAIPTNGYANIVRLNQRCSEDSLDAGQAEERVEWATKCGFITADDKNDALFTGGTKKRARPMYPLFATEDLASMWSAPVDRNAPCTVPDGYKVMAFCTSSCYTPDMALLFPEGFVPIKEARDEFLPKVVTLDDESSLDNIKLKTTDVASYTEEVRNTWHDILAFKTGSGDELKVTKNHPVVDSQGRVRSADSFKVGESLVHYKNGLKAITAIEPLRYFGKVYNITPSSESLKSNIVVAQGYLNGSAYYQNDGANFLNRTVLRRTIPTQVIE